MPRDYSANGTTPNSFQKRGMNNVFDVQHRTSNEGCIVRIDDIELDVKSIVQMHTNPINENLEDKLLIVKKEECDFLRWGSFIIGYGENIYLALTNPTSTDGVTLKTKIRELTNIVTWQNIEGKVMIFPTVMSRHLLYDDKTYTNNTKIFEEDDRIAIVLPKNKNTSMLRLIDDIYIDDEHYKILKIDEISDKTVDFENGVYQIVLIKTTFGDIFVNGEKLPAILRFARMKDKVLNSKSRELITLHNKVKSGDYITHEYIRDELGNKELRNYIVRSLVDMRLEYDITYIINCDAEFYMWDALNGEPKMIPCYVEDNRTRFREEWKANAVISNSEYQIIVQENDLTNLLGEKVGRIILKGKAYEVVGTDNISLENAIYVGLKSSKIDPNVDNLELGIADYNKMIDTPVTPDGKIVGDKEVFLGETYSYELNISNGSIVWKIDREISDSATIVEITENVCTVNISDNYKYIGKKIQLSAYVMQELIDSIELRIVSW